MWQIWVVAADVVGDVEGVVVVAVVVAAAVLGRVTMIVGITGGLGIVPSRYPNTPHTSAVIHIRPFQVIQFVPSNLSVSAKIGGAPPPVFNMIIEWFDCYVKISCYF